MLVLMEEKMGNACQLFRNRTRFGGQFVKKTVGKKFSLDCTLLFSQDNFHWTAAQTVSLINSTSRSTL